MEEEVRFERTRQRRLACMDVKGPYQEVLSPAFGRLMGWAGPNGFVAGPPMGIYLDSPQDVVPEELRSIVACPVTDNAEGTGEIRIEEWEPRQEAVYVHKGPYEDLGSAYGKVFDAIFREGYRVAGPPMEVYLTDPIAAPSEDLLTEVRVPVEKA